MQNKKNQSSVGLMIQRCHKWRQKRKQYMDQARQTSDEIERERLMQTAEHYGRIVAADASLFLIVEIWRVRAMLFPKGRIAWIRTIPFWHANTAARIFNL